MCRWVTAKYIRGLCGKMWWRQEREKDIQWPHCADSWSTERAGEPWLFPGPRNVVGFFLQVSSSLQLSNQLQFLILILQMRMLRHRVIKYHGCDLSGQWQKSRFGAFSSHFVFSTFENDLHCPPMEELLSTLVCTWVYKPSKWVSITACELRLKTGWGRGPQQQCRAPTLLRLQHGA